MNRKPLVRLKDVGLKSFHCNRNWGTDLAVVYDVLDAPLEPFPGVLVLPPVVGEVLVVHATQLQGGVDVEELVEGRDVGHGLAAGPVDLGRVRVLDLGLLAVVDHQPDSLQRRQQALELQYPDSPIPLKTIKYKLST